MAIKWAEDLGAPLAVVAVDLGTQQFAPKWNEWAAYAVVVLSYASDMFGIGPRNNQFVKNMGIAATPWAAKHVYNRVKGMTGGGATRMARWPAPLVEQPFGGARMV